MLKIDDIIKFVLSNDLKYTGAHQSAHPRTKTTLQILVPETQLKLIWKEFSNYIESQLLNGKSIKIPNFGVFIFTNNMIAHLVMARNGTAGNGAFHPTHKAMHVADLHFGFGHIADAVGDEPFAVVGRDHDRDLHVRSSDIAALNAACSGRQLSSNLLCVKTPSSQKPILKCRFRHHGELSACSMTGAPFIRRWRGCALHQSESSR